MDRTSAILSIMDRHHQKYAKELIAYMSECLSDEQFLECMRKVFRDICNGTDTAASVRWAIEQTWDNIDLYYEDDDSDEEVSPEQMIPGLKEGFDFVKVMFEIGLTDDALKFCDRIFEGMGTVLKEPKYDKYWGVLEEQKAELKDCLEMGECSAWFEI